jgi:ATP-dependent RNA helicase RhlE
MSYLRDIEKLIKRSIVRVEVEGFVPPAKADLMSDERPPRPSQGRGGQRQGQNAGPRGGQPSRHAAGRMQEGTPDARRAAKPAPERAGASHPAQPRKPRPQAALFSAKPGSRGH